MDTAAIYFSLDNFRVVPGWVGPPPIPFSNLHPKIRTRRGHPARRDDKREYYLQMNLALYHNKLFTTSQFLLDLILLPSLVYWL